MRDTDSLRPRLVVALEGFKRWAASQPQTREHLAFTKGVSSAIARAISSHEPARMSSHVATALHMIADCGPLHLGFGEELADVGNALTLLCRRTPRC